MITRPKFKDHWLIQPNNGEFVTQASQVQIYNQSQTITTHWLYHSNQFETLMRNLKKAQRLNDNLSIIDGVNDLERALTELNKCNYILVQIFNETRLSYKGFISWFVVGNLKYTFLIDGIGLRNHLQNLLKIFQNPNIIKFTFASRDIIQSLKRDFSVFALNIFDLFVLQKYYENLSSLGHQFRQDNLLDEQYSPQIIYQRPLKQKMNELVLRTSQKLFYYFLHLPMKPNCRIYYQQAYFVQVLNIYRQINNSQLIIHYYQHIPVSCITNQQYQNLNPKMEKLSLELNNFREHVAKMYDVSADFVLPRPIFLKILENCKISVLEIWQFYEEFNNKSIGLEMCKRIYDVIQLNQQLFQQEQKLRQLFGQQIQLKKEKDKDKQQNERQYIKKLLKDLKWGDSGEWLNRKDDPSIKLYKQIISIDQFDHSIGEQYTSKMKGDFLKKSQISKFLKYAQYMRNKDYIKLESFYGITKQIKQSNSKQDQFSQGTQQPQIIQQIKEKKPKCSRDLFGDPQQKPKQVKTETNLRQKQSKKQQFKEDLSKKKIVTSKNIPQKKIENVQQQYSDNQSRKSSQSSSFSILQMDQILIKRSDIKPLPSSIEQIYQMAQEAKRKADKKLKKQKKKTKNQPKKQVEFIPTYQDIEQLINYATSK